VCASRLDSHFQHSLIFQYLKLNLFSNLHYQNAVSESVMLGGGKTTFIYSLSPHTRMQVHLSPW